MQQMTNWRILLLETHLITDYVHLFCLPVICVPSWLLLWYHDLWFQNLPWLKTSLLLPPPVQEIVYTVTRMTHKVVAMTVLTGKIEWRTSSRSLPPTFRVPPLARFNRPACCTVDKSNYAPVNGETCVSSSTFRVRSVPKMSVMGVLVVRYERSHPRYTVV